MVFVIGAGGCLPPQLLCMAKQHPRGYLCRTESAMGKVV
jgi:hypothetical protein